MTGEKIRAGDVVVARWAWEVTQDLRVLTLYKVTRVDPPLADDKSIQIQSPESGRVYFKSPDELVVINRNTVFPSAKNLLDYGISCRETPAGTKRSTGWSVYWMECGAELTFFSGDEGPAEASSVDEVIDWMGGDQPCYLTPASLKRFGIVE